MLPNTTRLNRLGIALLVSGIILAMLAISRKNMFEFIGALAAIVVGFFAAKT